MGLCWLRFGCIVISALLLPAIETVRVDTEVLRGLCSNVGSGQSITNNNVGGGGSGVYIKCASHIPDCLRVSVSDESILSLQKFPNFIPSTICTRVC